MGTMQQIIFLQPQESWPDHQLLTTSTLSLIGIKNMTKLEYLQFEI